MKKYLLSIEELLDQDAGELLQEAFSKVDAGRRHKAERIKPGRSQAACLGAGLLLQFAVGEALEPEEASRAETAGCGCPEDAAETAGRDLGLSAYVEADNGLQRCSVSGLLDRMRDKPLLSLDFRYGGKGKPYFRDYPFFFNLSHSGDYVICVLSAEEVGVDIQQHRAGAGRRIAARYFSAQEKAALENCKEDGDELFFRLWTRKEAYGKLTGQGIADTMGLNFLPQVTASEFGGKGDKVSETDRKEKKEMPISGTGRREHGETMNSGIVRDVSQGKRLSMGRIPVWEEYGGIPGYSISLCYWGDL